jgi:hypothetical protein
MIIRRAAVVTALELTRNEGYIWLVLDTCFGGEPDKRNELKSFSARYLRTLCASTNTSLAELRQAVEGGVVEAGGATRMSPACAPR